MKDIYNEIADRIIDQLEHGIIPWRKPWSGVNSGAISHVTGRAYSLLNQLMLNDPGEYITFNQCKAEGGRVKKGAKAKNIVFWKILQRERRDAAGNVVTDNNGQPIIDGIPMLRYIQVFRLDDCEGIAPKWDNRPTANATPDEHAESVLIDYITREKIALETTISDDAYYSPMRDLIHLPLMEQFDNTAEYYGTAYHEAIHSTGHASRLNRFEGDSAAAAFGSEAYSKEELVAEIGSACCLHEMGLETPNTFKNSAAYIQAWLRTLKNDKRMIIGAASKAEKAVKLVMNITDKTEGD